MNSMMMNKINNNSCLLCGNETHIMVTGIADTRFGIDGCYNINKCNSCELFQTLPPPKSKELKILYETYYNFQSENNSSYIRARKAFYNSFFYQLWLVIDGDIAFHTNKGKGYLLDVGCNEGRGLKIFKMNGFTPEGLEINEIAAKYAMQEGFYVSTSKFEDFNPKQLYDIAVLSNVLEHSLNANDMIRNVSRILKKGGKVWISCPNVCSWQRYVFGRYWINWHIPFHIYHFSKHSLEKLLSKEGFQIKSMKNISPALWLAHSIIIACFSEPGKSTSKLRSPSWVAILMILTRGLFFPILWLGNFIGIGDCIIVEAKKVKDSKTIQLIPEFCAQITLREV